MLSQEGQINYPKETETKPETWTGSRSARVTDTQQSTVTGYQLSVETTVVSFDLDRSTLRVIDRTTGQAIKIRSSQLATVPS
ncbi:hypothetical protein ACLKA7_015720 [Drosophila subpalustris]